MQTQEIDNAIATLDQLRKNLEGLRRFATLLESLAAGVSEAPPPTKRPTRKKAPATEGGDEGKAPEKRMNIGSRVLKALQKAGEPLSVSQLLFYTKAKNRRGIHTTLSRLKKQKKVNNPETGKWVAL